MKRMIVLVMLVVLGSFSWAFAEEMVSSEPVAPVQYSAPTSFKVPDAVKAGATNKTKRGPSEVSKLSSKIQNLTAETGKLKTATSENAQAVSELSGNVEGLATAVVNNTETLKNLGEKSDTTYTTVVREARGVGEQIYKNTWLLGALIVICAAVAIAVMQRLFWGNRNSVSEAVRPLKESSTALSDSVSDVHEDVKAGFAEMKTSFEEMRNSFTELPGKVAKEVKTLDTSAFEFEAAGHMVTYQSPIEGIEEGYYLLLHVPKGMVGDAATYERDHEANYGIAKKECRKTMRRYLNREFDGPEFVLQRELIGHLITSDALSYRKIS